MIAQSNELSSLVLCGCAQTLPGTLRLELGTTPHYFWTLCQCMSLAFPGLCFIYSSKPVLVLLCIVYTNQIHIGMQFV